MTRHRLNVYIKEELYLFLKEIYHVERMDSMTQYLERLLEQEKQKKEGK